MKPAKQALESSKAKPTAGTVMAAEWRARANMLTEGQRQANMVRAIEHVYGKPAAAKRAHRR